MFQLFRLSLMLLLLYVNVSSLSAFQNSTDTTRIDQSEVSSIHTALTFFESPASNEILKEDSNEVHEITLYAMPTMYPLDWSSPSSLYKTMLQVYLKTISLKDNYLLGHVAVRLKSPMLERPLYTAQSSKGWQERIDLVLNQRVGFGILGAALAGRIEPSSEIQHKLSVYRERNKLAYITFRVNKAAMSRMLKFYHAYQEKFTPEYAASDFYGGAFWPRYHNEGAGCATFAFSMLDLGNLIPDEAQEWKIDLKIPMNIIGGEFNKGKKVKNRTIKRTKSWYKGPGIKNIDYAEYFVWDPAYIYEWVLRQHHQPGHSHYRLDREEGVPGLYKDARNVKVNLNEPIFIQRPDTNLFINHYYMKHNLGKK